MTKLAYALVGGFLAACLVFSVGGWTGYKIEHQAAENDKLVQNNAALARQGRLNAQGQQLAGELKQSRQKNADLLAERRAEVSHVTTTYVPSPGAAAVALPDYRFTVGAVCLWDSFGVQANAGNDSARADARAACLGAPDSLTLSGITPADALDNELVNAAACTDDRDTLIKDQAFLASLAKP